MDAGERLADEAPFAFGLVRFEPPVEPGERGRRPWSTQLEIERADRLEPGDSFVTLAARQRMLGERKQRHRGQLLGRG